MRALKPLSEQVVVITGATSGIGLATARAAVERGAAVVLAARNEAALKALAGEISAKGGRAAYVAADVADPAQVKAIAAEAQRAFGGFDTWINDAGAAIYGRIEDVPVEDQRRLFETSYWGVVHGSLCAVARLKLREEPGALINVGSILSDQALPVQGVQAAAKHAVKGFTNALRMELMRTAPQVSVTLIKPSPTDTPQKEHARNYAGHPATSPPPVYDPALAAEAILYAAEHRVREITVGGFGRLLVLFGQLAPLVAEPVFAWVLPALHRDRSENHRRDRDSLSEPGRGGSERAATFPVVRRNSLYTRAQLNPRTTLMVLAGVAALAWAGHGLKRALDRAAIRAEVREHERARAARLVEKAERRAARRQG